MEREACQQKKNLYQLHEGECKAEPKKSKSNNTLQIKIQRENYAIAVIDALGFTIQLKRMGWSGRLFFSITE
jgi:hypothetical protein